MLERPYNRSIDWFFDRKKSLSVSFSSRSWHIKLLVPSMGHHFVFPPLPLANEWRAPLSRQNFIYWRRNFVYMGNSLSHSTHLVTNWSSTSALSEIHTSFYPYKMEAFWYVGWMFQIESVCHLSFKSVVRYRISLSYIVDCYGVRSFYYVFISVCVQLNSVMDYRDLLFS